MELDHILIPSRDKVAAARQLAEILGVPWSDHGVGPFAPVFVNDRLTLDFDTWPEPVPKVHFAFHVTPEEFEAILGRIRAAGLPYRSSPVGPVDHQLGSYAGGPLVYWDQPDGHAWEILTTSYARQP